MMVDRPGRDRGHLERWRGPCPGSEASREEVRMFVGLAAPDLVVRWEWRRVELPSPDLEVSPQVSPPHSLPWRQALVRRGSTVRERAVSWARRLSHGAWPRGGWAGS